MIIIKYPKIKSVIPQADKILLVEFDNGITKHYDVKKLIQEDEYFVDLLNDDIFNLVKTDNGYGISWNDELDLSESELWSKGY